MKCTLIGLLSLLVILTQGQNSQGKSDDAGRIVLAAVISTEMDNLTTSSQSFLKNKLNRITSNYGMGGNAKNERFIITANVQIITKDITATAPPMHVYTLEVGFYIGDGIDGNLFASISKVFKGVGETETKAYKSALKNIKPNDIIFRSFIQEGKNKIMEYYNTQCDLLLKEALTKADIKQFELALNDLTAIPEVCKECYFKTQDTLVYVYKKMIENLCQENISKAKSFIANADYESASNVLSGVTYDINCYSDVQVILKEIKNHRCAVALGKAIGAWANRDAKLAANYLTEIPTDSECYKEAQSLSKNISSKLDADEKRDWDLAYEMYNRDMSYKENQIYELKKAQIESAKEIGVAYGSNQPQNVTYNYSGWY